MITDSNHACFTKMSGCGLQEEELNRCAVVLATQPLFVQDKLFPQSIQAGFFIGAC